MLMSDPDSNISLTDVLQVEGTVDKGVVNAHLTKRPGESKYEYKYLFLDVPGTKITREYEEAKRVTAQISLTISRKTSGIFGKRKG